MDNISLVTYAGQTVTPLDDALVYETAINQSGMIYGGIVTIKSANNLHISSGHGIVCGRKFTIFDSDIQVALSSSGTLLGRLYVQLDLSNVGTPIQLLVETGASLTPVQQDNNVNIMNGVFEFNIATFTVDTSTISNVIMVAPSAEPSTGAGSVITVTTSEASLAGKMCTITDGTTTLNANFDNTGKAVFYGVQMVGRVLVNATDGEYYASGEVNITYFGLYSTSIAFWGATINLSTTTPEFYGQNITVKQDGILVSTISFDGTGHATYIAPALGVYDFTVTYGGNEYTATVNVTEETTYSKSIDIAPAGLDLSAWITAGSTTDYPLNPSSYPTFADLEADEAAILQLMTVHASVDYLATATAGDSLMEDVINSDVCAKWINLRDYALDTLSANSDIKDEMDTADKYGYGEWGIIDSTTTPPTWGALGCVPIMTANNAPYGTASAYQVFDGNASTTASGTDFSYQSVNPICVRKFECSVSGGTLQGSNDGSTYTDISYPSSNTTYYMYHRVHFASSQTVNTLQFFGRELPVKQASAPTDGREYIQIGSDYYTEDWGEKDFASGSTRKTIYDHGVELETIGTYVSSANAQAEKRTNCLYANKDTSSYTWGECYVENFPFDSSKYSTLNAVFGNEGINTVNAFLGVGQSLTTQGQVYSIAYVYMETEKLPNNISLDISSVNGNYYLVVGVVSGGGTLASRMTVKEIWLE